MGKLTISMAMFQFAMLASQGVTISHENINHWDILTISIMEIQKQILAGMYPKVGYHLEDHPT